LYLPFCVFNYVSPGLSVLYGITGFRIEKLRPSLAAAPPAQNAVM
jgi:NhaC family Na+:H+ antiporter